MVDPGLAVAALGPSALVVKILGPTADYVGEGVREWTEKRAENVQRVFARAGERLGDDELSRPGAVPPKVLKGILEEAQFADDELAAEYLGGVLASSRTGQPRDDRGASLVALVGRLSSYQLRTHYVLYSAAQRAFADERVEINLGMSDERADHALFLSFEDYTDALDLQGEEFVSILVHVLNGLLREDLIEDRYSWGASEHLRATQGARDYGNQTGGLVYRVTMLGIELFCAAHGLKGNPMDEFKGASDRFAVEAPFPEATTSGLIRELPEYEPSTSTATTAPGS
jgi:hypothetical protein